VLAGMPSLASGTGDAVRTSLCTTQAPTQPSFHFPGPLILFAVDIRRGKSAFEILLTVPVHLNSYSLVSSASDT
jgi:hypothetical protein